MRRDANGGVQPALPPGNLSAGQRRETLVRNDCDPGMAPAWVQTGGMVCPREKIRVYDRVLGKFVTVEQTVCHFEPIGYKLECQPYLETL
jgi:hypothetical protein